MPGGRCHSRKLTSHVCSGGSEWMGSIKGRPEWRGGLLIDEQQTGKLSCHVGLMGTWPV